MCEKRLMTTRIPTRKPIRKPAIPPGNAAPNSAPIPAPTAAHIKLAESIKAPAPATSLPVTGGRLLFVMLSTDAFLQAELVG